jgi:predicted transcriptional regulator
MQIIQAPSGEEMIVLSRAEYDALLAAAQDFDEDAEDAAIYDSRKAQLLAGHEQVLPAEVSAAIVKGDSLLRAVRHWRGLTQAELAERAGIAQGYLSDLESGRRSGSTETWATLSGILDTALAPLEPPKG